LLYDGTAFGKAYLDSVNDLQKAVLLGTYESGMRNHIRVELELDKSVGMEYCELLAEIDWKFMTEEIANSKEPNPVNEPDTKGAGRPKTEDETELMKYLISMSIAAGGVFLCIWFLRKQREKKEVIIV